MEEGLSSRLERKREKEGKSKDCCQLFLLALSPPLSNLKTCGSQTQIDFYKPGRESESKRLAVQKIMKTSDKGKGGVAEEEEERSGCTGVM